MDIYIIFDAVAVILAGLIFWKAKTKESLLLFCFFALAATIYSFVYLLAGEFSADLSDIWVKIFIGMSVVFGLMSKSHPIVLGYAAYVIVVSMNSVAPLEYYSQMIYSIYALQLLVVFYDRNHTFGGHRNRVPSVSHGRVDS